MSHDEAVKIDTELAELWGRQNGLFAKLDSLKLSLARDAGIKPVYVTRNRREVRESLDKIVELVESKLDSMMLWDRRSAEGHLDKLAEVRDEIKAVKALIEPLQAKFDADPWSRFFLVTNQNGHIHSSMSCHSCNIRTQFSWLPSLSGLTEKDAVDAHGTVLCSHCFPSAPVEWTLGIQKEADPDECPNSGQYQSNPSRRRYVICEHCGANVNVTSTGNLRKHKKASA